MASGARAVTRKRGQPAIQPFGNKNKLAKDADSKDKDELQMVWGNGLFGQANSTLSAPDSVQLLVKRMGHEPD